MVRCYPRRYFAGWPILIPTRAGRSRIGCRCSPSRRSWPLPRSLITAIWEAFDSLGSLDLKLKRDAICGVAAADARSVRQAHFITASMTEPMHVERTARRPLLIVAILGAAFFAWIAWRVGTGDRQPTRAAVECKGRYASARSFADTAQVDGTYPTNYAQVRGEGRGPATCGYLRREQLLP